MAGNAGPKRSPISDAIRDELMRYPDTFTNICERAQVARGGTLRKWLRGEAQLMPTTLTKLAAELGYEIRLVPRGQS